MTLRRPQVLTREISAGGQALAKLRSPPGVVARKKAGATVTDVGWSP
ncbi:MAG: hypothetical protein ACK53L_24880 [Pirellulaceae bacterium]